MTAAPAGRGAVSLPALQDTLSTVDRSDSTLMFCYYNHPNDQLPGKRRRTRTLDWSAIDTARRDTAERGVAPGYMAIMFLSAAPAHRG